MIITEKDLNALKYAINNEKWRAITPAVGFMLLKGMGLEVSFQEDGSGLNKSDKVMIIKLIENSSLDLINRIFDKGVKELTDEQIKDIIHFCQDGETAVCDIGGDTLSEISEESGDGFFSIREDFV